MTNMCAILHNSRYIGFKTSWQMLTGALSKICGDQSHLNTMTLIWNKHTKQFYFQLMCKKNLGTLLNAYGTNVILITYVHKTVWHDQHAYP